MCVARHPGFKGGVFGVKILSILLPYLLEDEPVLMVNHGVLLCLIFQGNRPATA
jgi:hypothetical protein